VLQGPAVVTTQLEPRQQPKEQVLGVHPLQTPALQVWLVGHAWQVSPCLPHSLSLLPILQFRPSGEQHPTQVAGSQTHAPLMHRVPRSHAGAEPQAQTPLVVHESDRSGSQAVQARPDLPHAPRGGGPPSALCATSQMLSLQQPLGHAVASHRQAPLTQWSPWPHAGPDPQEQTPALQESAATGSQAMQAEPFLPQLKKSDAWHVSPEQHPSGQRAGQSLHTPPVQVWPKLHGSQAKLAVPQLAAPASLRGKQVVPEQHPLGHDVKVQAHRPLMQSCPGWQGSLVPHRHCPCRQRSEPASGRQGGLLPQRHSPVKQVSELAALQVVQIRSLPQLRVL